MVSIRKVTLGLLLASALSALFMAVFLLWNYREWPQVPLRPPYAAELDERTRQLQERVEVLNKRASEVELLLLLLLGASGLYSIVFIGSSYLSAMRFARQADRSIARINHQIGLSMGDLRELKAEVQRTLLDQLNESQSRMTAELAGLYRSFASVCASTDPARAISCLDRAIALAPSPEVHYELACCYAATHDFEHAVRELALAFQEHSKALDERLARDIEEGGYLYELASTPPFDKAVNDVLLTVVL
jgi:tetratricopeptide (TPR) repeat protein